MYAGRGLHSWVGLEMDLAAVRVRNELVKR